MLMRPPPSGASTSGTSSGTRPPIHSNTDLVRVGARARARVRARARFRARARCTVRVRCRVRWMVRVRVRCRGRPRVVKEVAGLVVVVVGFLQTHLRRVRLRVRARVLRLGSG